MHAKTNTAITPQDQMAQKSAGRVSTLRDWYDRSTLGRELRDGNMSIFYSKTHDVGRFLKLGTRNSGKVHRKQSAIVQLMGHVKRCICKKAASRNRHS